VHDLGHRFYPKAHAVRQRLYLELSARRHVSRADHIVVDSESTRRDLIQLYSASPARISVAYLGVDETMRPVGHSGQAEVARRLGLADNEHYFLHVGTLQPRKNLRRLLSAFASVAADLPRHHLVLAGRTGWGGDDLGEAAVRLGIGGRVRRIGYIDRAQLPALYSGSQATVMPSLYEGFGLPVLEAMACGAPVVASSSSSLPEIVGDAGLVVDPFDVDGWAAAMRRVASDAGLRDSLSESGLRRSSEFTWARCADAILEALTDAAGRARA
jgi:glycosyltransferase involved in cell wall biosynthesis